MTAPLDDEQQLRYARQIALANWGLEGQQKLHGASVLIVGLGGLGAPVVTYLAGAGVGALTLNDFDRVDLSNLPRQPIHDGSGIGQPKTVSAARTVARLNPDVHVTTIDQRLSAAQMTRAVRGHDVVIDASDNFGTRFTINEACVREGVALVSIAAIRAEGQLAVFRADLTDVPCYACLYSNSDEAGEDCTGQGVMTPLVGVIGSLGALEAVKLLLGSSAAEPVTRLHCFDAMTLSWRSLRVTRDPACAVCGHV